VIIVWFLPSCGSSRPDGDVHRTHLEEPVITGEPSAYSVDDVGFANKMILREEQAIEMSRLVPVRSNTSELVTFAGASVAALQPDLQVLKALRAQWNQDQDNQAQDSRPGVTTSVAKLQSLRGKEFDTRWLQAMISLDQDAIKLASAEIIDGKNADAIVLAKQIVQTRQAEIGQMHRMGRTAP